MTGPSDPERRAKPRELGDFPTPPGLVSEVLGAIGPIGGRFDRVLEPTCGRGHFLRGILEQRRPPREVRGIEIQPDHAEAARSIEGRGLRPLILTADLFRLDLARDIGWEGDGPLLVVGNLPWVTTAAVGASGGSNGPDRSNSRKVRGIEALTGPSNFDISEAIWIKLIRELAPERPTIALLCKRAVARAVLRLVGTDGLPVTRATLWRVDAQRWFRASVEACLLRLEIGPGPRAVEAEVYPDLSAAEPESSLGFEGGRMIADLAAHRRSSFAEGTSPLTWRQGIKHDAAGVMELILGDDGQSRNKFGELVEVEPDRVFPLLKGTDLAGPKRPRPRRSVLITQRTLADNTLDLARTAPRLWAYLARHRDAFDRRKSAIYRGRPPFSIFGVGDYSFAPFKVAVSGLHKDARFRLVESIEGCPTMLDDTCYFLPCRSRDQASILVEALNGAVAQDLIRALTFRDAKRPITKAVLQRVDLKAILGRDGHAGFWQADWESDWTGRSLAPVPEFEPLPDL
ncbi:class I SAM-dependent methyltransferase [Tundrisphaera lichenicola]|uniref:class I SAM-dependent methyltransferase n=1 Tax=Tundrisphaera lichenicola TaxID=2029860 RepID=UPI003EBA1961